MKKVLLSLMVCALFILGATPALAAVDPSDLSFTSKLVNNNGIVTDELNPSTLNGTTASDIQAQANLPAKYDLRDVNGVSYISPVKFQYPWGCCWAFGTICSIESNAMLKGQKNANYSEKALTWYANVLQGGASTADNMKEGFQVTTSIGLDDSNHYESGGTTLTAIGQLASWNGSSTTEQVPFKNTSGKTKEMKINGKTVSYYSPDGTWGMDDSHLYDNAYHVQDVKQLNTDISNKDAVKQSIMSNGSVLLGYSVQESAPYFNTATSAQYIDVKTSSDHAVSIVGWDDNYSKTNFTEGHQPTNDGAWIVKNNYSAAWADNGYFYLSYEDKSIEGLASFDADVASNNTDGQFQYTHNYQYDYLANKSNATGTVDNRIVKKAAEAGQVLKMANIFTADGCQSLKAVSAYSQLDNGGTVTTSIYKITDGNNPESGTLVETQTDAIDSGEYKTIVLNKAIDLAKGERFSVVQTQKDNTTGAYGLSVEMGVQDGQKFQTKNQSTHEVTSEYTLTNVATVAAGQSFIYGIGNTGESDAWHDLADGSFTGRYMTFTYDVENEDGTTTASVAYPGNVMIKAFTTDTPCVTYEVHGRNYGWSQGWKTDGETAGTTGQALRLEALQAKITDTDGIANGDAASGLGITYQAHVQNKGWMDWTADGDTAGTTGQSLQMEAVRIKLTGDKAADYTITYRVHVQNEGWTQWVSDGADAGTTGRGLRAEAVEIKIEKK